MLDKDIPAKAAVAAEPNCEFPPVDGDQLLKDVSGFIGRYLRCSEHQRTILACWVLHTHHLTRAAVTPYLAIQSTEKQSGKTLCLQLLNLALVTGAKELEIASKDADCYAVTDSGAASGFARDGVEVQGFPPRAGFVFARGGRKLPTYQLFRGPGLRTFAPVHPG